MHQLLATATSWPLMVPLQRTLRVTFFSPKPQCVGQLTFEVHQNGAQGAVAQHTKSALGFWLSLQKVSATIAPAGWLSEEPTQCTVRDRMLPRRPHSVGHTSALTVQLYVTHSGVAAQLTELAGLSPVHQLSATTTGRLLIRPLQRTERGSVVAARPHLVGHCAAEVAQAGEQGHAGQRKILSGLGKLLQKLSATTTPAGLPAENARQCSVRVMTCAAWPQYAGHVSELTAQLYVRHSAVAGQITMTDGLSPLQKLSATTINTLLTRPLHCTARVTFVAAKPHSVGHDTVAVNQNGAQGGVAGQLSKPFGRE
jgi:hypothetical protein